MQINPMCEEINGGYVTYSINAMTDTNGNVNVIAVGSNKIYGMIFTPDDGSYGEIVTPWIYPTSGGGSIHLHASTWDGQRAANVPLIGKLRIHVNTI